MVIASSIKTYFIDKSVVKSFDTTYDGWPAWIAAAVEIHVGLLCASAPMLRPFFQRHNLLRSPLRLPLQKGDLEIGKPSFRATIYPENVTGPAMTYKVKVYRFSRFYNRSWEDVSANKTKRDKYDRRPRDILGHKPGQRSIDKMLPPLPPDADSQSVLFS